MDYWKEHAEIAMNEAGISGVTDDQLDTIAGVIESAHEFYRQMHGNDVASVNFVASEKRQQQDAIKAVEREGEIALAEAERALKRSREERSALDFRMQDLRRENEKLRAATT